MITKEQARQHIVELLQYIGENPDREGLKETPDRILKMWGEIFRGYDKNQRPKIQFSLNILFKNRPQQERLSRTAIFGRKSCANWG